MSLVLKNPTQLRYAIMLAGGFAFTSSTQDTILSYNVANTGQYIRDLTYTQNVDTVANGLSGTGGGQDSNSARFKLLG
jgi:hypothetical protein